MKKRKTKPKQKKKHTGARRGSYEWKEQMSISYKAYWKLHPRKKKA